MTTTPPRIHPSAFVEDNAVIGDGTSIWHLAQVRTGARVGSGCIVGKDAYIDTEVVVGDGCKIQNGANLYRGLRLGDNVFVGPHAQFTNDLFPRAEFWDDERLVATTVLDGASIGANATVICGITIGRYATVGAGAVVTRDVPDHALVLGNPARLRGFVCRCGRRLSGADGREGAVTMSCSCGQQTEIPADVFAQLEGQS